MTHVPSKVEQLITGLALAAILATAAFLRFSHANWDDGYQLHPDERAILFVAQGIKLPSSLAELIDSSRSPLNPYRDPSTGTERSFPYGHLPLYLTVAADQLLAQVCRGGSLCEAIPAASFVGRLLNVDQLPEFDHLTYVGRALAALMDTLDVLVAYLLARDLFSNRPTGLLAAMLLAVTVLHIQNSHFGTFDSALAFCCTLSLWLLTHYASSGRMRYSIAAGIAAGMAVSCKLTGILLVIPLVISQFDLHKLLHRHITLLSIRLKSPPTLGLTMLAGIIVFAVANPYALLDAHSFVSDAVTQAGLAGGSLDAPFTRQYSGTVPVLYAMEQQALWELGPSLTLTIYVGLGWGLWQVFRLRQPALGVIVVWAATALCIGLAYAKYPRYLMPMTPALIVIGSGLLTVSRGLPRLGKCLLCGVVVASSAGLALAFVAMYDVPHPWVASSQWIYANVPPGSKLVSEKWDDALPLNLSGSEGQYTRDEHYTAYRLDPFAEPDNSAKMSALASTLAESDYLILASNRLYGVIPGLPDRYPLTSTYYRLLFGGDLGYRIERTWYRYPRILGWNLVDDPFRFVKGPQTNLAVPADALVLGPADESFTLYDHPLVLLFHNTEHLSSNQLEQRLVGTSPPSS